jgi:hypothetical protein
MAPVAGRPVKCVLSWPGSRVGLDKLLSKRFPGFVYVVERGSINAIRSFCPQRDGLRVSSTLQKLCNTVNY